MEAINWEPKKVKVSELIENPDNPKIITDAGRQKLKKSLGKFGLAGTMPVNQDMMIIDGHSRKAQLIEAGIEEVWVSMPSRLLTEKEYKEMNAVFDIVKAGDPDYSKMTEEIIDEWVTDEEIIDGDGKTRTIKHDPAIFPIAPKFNEKYDAIIIISDNETDTAFLINKLNLGTEKNYKSSQVGQTFITTAQKAQEWFK